jgi:peptide/nickel transport system permease protein
MTSKINDFFSSKEYKRLKKNKLAVLGLGVIFMLFVVCLFGYMLIPENTKDANSQRIDIKLKNPGFSMNYIALKSLNTHSFSEYFFGTENPESSIWLADSFYVSSDLFFYQNKFHVWKSEPLSKILTKDEIRNHLALEKIIVSKIKKRTFWLGTDSLGRDVYSRLILGARISLSVGFIAVIISLLIGVVLGMLSGYYGGWIDRAIMWIINVFWSIPTVLLSMALLVAFPSESKHQYIIVFVAVGLTMWVDTARLIRGQFMQIKQKSFVEATQSLGFSDFRIIFKHILPNTFTTLVVITSSNFATAILLESGLSYLGLGVQPPTPSWGSMMREYFAYIGSDLSYLSIFPGLCISMAVFAFNAFGNGLRDAFDIKGL